jgi:hypothetical protein
MSLIPDFHIVFLNDAQKAVVKQALADAGHVVEVAAKSAGDDLVLALKSTSVGTFIASEISTLKDASLTGLQKMEQVVEKAIPAAIALFAAGGVAKTAEEVEDAVRGAAQLIYNDTVSTTIPALAADVGKIVGAVTAPTALAPA